MTNAELFKKIFGIYAEEFWAYPKEEMLDWIASEAPTASSIEIVRCYACKYFDQAEKYCRNLLTADEDGFCKWSKRREDA